VYLPWGVDGPAVKLRTVVPGVEGFIDTIDLESVAVIPEGAFGRDRLTAPANPLRLDTVIVVELRTGNRGL